jgi:hypothetical protein
MPEKVQLSTPAASGAWASTQADSIIVAANKYRDNLVIQQWSSDPTYLAFGQAAVSLSGYAMMTAGSVCVVHGPLAREAVHAINASSKTASGGYQEGLSIA